MKDISKMRIVRQCIVIILAIALLLIESLSLEDGFSVSIVEAAPLTQIDPEVTVRLTIERIRGLDGMEGLFGGDPDFYAIVSINGEELPKTPTIHNRNNISPDWEFFKPVNMSTGSVPIVIEVRDKDGGLRFDDDHVDLTPGGDRNLNLMVNLNACLSGNTNAVSGDLSGFCGTTLISKGDGNDRAEIQFRLVVETPPTTPGTNVHCIHEPIWPQATDAVTFTATALDGALIPKFANVDIEIWLNTKSSPFATISNNSSLSQSGGAFNAGDTISYGCLVRDNSTGEKVWSGWRSVYIDRPSTGQAVPILYTGPSGNRIDIVFIADRDDYTGPNDPNFLGSVRDVIRDAYYARVTSSVDIFLRNQDKLNFWIALDTGDADGPPDNSTPCTRLDPPSNWDDSYTFADTGAILHTISFRDCASPSERVFSSEPFSLDTFLHETGHSPFGLSDEYCCDPPYFQTKLFPNVYHNQQVCRNDTLAIGVSDACQQIRHPGTGDTVNWYRLDPASTYFDDLMTDHGNHTLRPADTRRISWFFQECRSPSGKC